MQTLWHAAHPDGRLALSSELARERPSGGHRSSDRQVVTVLTPHLRYPIQTRPPWAPQEVPREGTLILRDVENLDAHEQRNLLHWLDDAGAQVQLISVVSKPLFRLVLEGRFLDALYYRINVLYITAADALSIGGVG